MDEKSAKKYSRLIILSLLFFTALNAIVAGALLMTDPSGQLMGLDMTYIQRSPFTSYLIPGITLFVVNGILNIVAATLVLQQHPKARSLVKIQGIILCGWIMVQIVWVQDIHVLHVIMLAIGVALVALGYKYGTS